MSGAKSSPSSPAAPISSSKASTVPPEELEARQALGRRYEAAQELNRIQEKVMGLRLAVNTLIKEERRLNARAEELEKIAEQKAGWIP